MQKRVEGKLERITGRIYDIKKKRVEMTQADIVFDDGTRVREWFDGDLRRYVGKRVELKYED